ncbi:MAG: hypothetical protein R6X21_13060 [Candidatus Aminicenantes bacterium]
MRKTPLALVLMLTMAFVSTAAFAQETVTLPSKPKSPRAGRVLELREVFRISDAQGGFFFKSPKNLQPAPDGGMMVVDDGEFLRFDAAGKFVVNMFRAGQGPGELRQIGDYLVRDGEVLAFQESPMKCVVTGLDGKFLREFKPDAPVSRLLGPYSGRLLAAVNAPPEFDKVQKSEGDLLDIVWTLKLMSGEGRVEATSLTFPTKWFVKRLPGAVIADYMTFLLCAPLGDGLVAVANEDGYVINIVDPAKNAVVRTIRRDYRRVKYAPEKSDEAPGGARRLAPPRDHFNDIQKLWAVDGRVWAVTSTVEPGKGVLVDVISPGGEYLDSFYLPLPKGVSLHGLARHPLTVSGRTVLALEVLEDGLLEGVKYAIVD